MVTHKGEGRKGQTGDTGANRRAASFSAPLGHRPKSLANCRIAILEHTEALIVGAVERVLGGECKGITRHRGVVVGEEDAAIEHAKGKDIVVIPFWLRVQGTVEDIVGKLRRENPEVYVAILTADSVARVKPGLADLVLHKLDNPERRTQTLTTDGDGRLTLNIERSKDNVRITTPSGSGIKKIRVRAPFATSDDVHEIGEDGTLAFDAPRDGDYTIITKPGQALEFETILHKGMGDCLVPGLERMLQSPPLGRPILE